MNTADKRRNGGKSSLLLRSQAVLQIGFNSP
ncbi:MAG: hypothetical protein ACI9G1_004139, partial [Pirellulaceae bacterium]